MLVTRMFSTLPKPIFSTSFTFILSAANALNLDLSTILSFGKGLNKYLRRLLHAEHTCISPVSRKRELFLTYHV